MHRAKRALPQALRNRSLPERLPVRFAADRGHPGHVLHAAALTFEGARRPIRRPSRGSERNSCFFSGLGLNRGKLMPDEFPTLEAVAALGVLALLIRTLLVASEMRVVPVFAASLGRSLRAGDRTAALAACSSADAPALGRAARQLISLVGDPPYRADAALDLQNEQSELEHDLGRRAESGRARDLIVLAVLIGAMTFAALSHLPVSAWFQGLAAGASLLLVVGYAMRS